MWSIAFGAGEGLEYAVIIDRGLVRTFYVFSKPRILASCASSSGSIISGVDGRQTERLQEHCP